MAKKEVKALQIHRLNLEQIARAVVLACGADIPVALWGPVGVGKSSVVQQIAKQLSFGLYDVRLSDKEPSDLGGIPYPNHEEGKVRYYVPGLLPFDTKEKAIVFFDEFDRADMAVQNAALQLILDRKINGHSLSPNARIVLAGNASTDVGTSPLTKAAANRVCHLYVDAESEAAVGSWKRWAVGNGISEELISFAEYRREVWANGREKKSEDMAELAFPTPRSFEYADKLRLAAKEVKFETKDIIDALVAGCVGTGASVEFLGWCEMRDKCPRVEDVYADPAKCKLPTENDILYAFGQTLISHVSTTLDGNQLNAVCEYVTRWPREQAQAMFTQLAQRVPTVAGIAAYRKWTRTQ